jgi:cyclic pyranopterin phosphate synthase
MPDDTKLNYIPQPHLLTNEEILTLLQEVFIPLGFTKFRLTGGEPLIRTNITDLVAAITKLPQTQDLALTTNGFFLKELAQDLYDAGLNRINISLDSLDPKTFNTIIGNKGKSLWEQTWQGILTAYEVGFNPLKINVVIIPGVNDHEILDLAALTIAKNWHVRFIEFMPIGNSNLFQEKAWLDSAEIRQKIKQKWGLEESRVRGNGPADVFKIPEAKGTLGFISQMSECFCDRCNRVRLSADGWLRPCLLNETGQIDLKTELRLGHSYQVLQTKVKTLLQLKPDINFKERDSGSDSNYRRTMSQIGG